MASSSGFRRSRWMAAVLVLAGAGVVNAPASAHASAAEIRLGRDYLASLVEKMPPLTFNNDQARGTVREARLVAIDPQGRRFVCRCQVVGEYRAAPKLASPWRSFRFDIAVAIHVEASGDGTPRLRITVEEVRRREIEGLAGTLARMMGRYFDDLVTRVAAGKAASLNDKLNSEVVRKVAALREYGVFTRIEYAAEFIVLHFDVTRFQAEGIAGHVYPAAETEAPAGTVPLYRAIDPRSGGHVYTIDPTAIGRLGLKSEGVACRAFDHAEPGTVPLYRWHVSRDQLYTTDRNGEGSARQGYRFDGVACFVFPDARPGTVPFYRFFDPHGHRHFYTLHPHAEFAKGEGPPDLPSVPAPALTRRPGPRRR